MIPPRLSRRVNVPGVLTIVAALAVWQAVVGTGLLEYESLPAPSEIVTSGVPLLASWKLFGTVAHTLQVTVVGWLVASVLGIGIGVWLGLSSVAWRYGMATVEAMRAVPPVALVPLAVLIFGFSKVTEIVVITYASTWLVAVNTIQGVRLVPSELLDVSRTLRLGQLGRLFRIVLPAATPSMVVGLRLALSLSLVLAVVAEMVGTPSGLGSALILAARAVQPGLVFAYVLIIGLLGMALNAGFRYVSSRALPGFARELAGESAL